MGLLGSILGAATSIIPGGGLIKGALGLAGDVLGGMGGSNSATSSGSTSGVNTQTTELRAWTPAEQTALDNAMAGLAQSGVPMTPEIEAALRERIFQANYQPAAQAINQGLQTGQATDYANAARRGAGASSATVTGGKIQEARAATALGTAAQNATISAENAYLAEEQNRRAAATSYIDTMNSLWSNRLHGSKIVNTSSGTSTSTGTEGGGSLTEQVLGGLGSALGNKDSFLNTSILGRKKSAATSSGRSSGGAGSIFTPNTSRAMAG